MAFEIPIDVDYFDHPKTLKLISLLGKLEADIYPLRLWRWAASYAKDGQLPSDPALIERSVGWRGRGGRLVTAMQEAGFIDKDTFTLHNWNKHIGRSIAIYEQKKKKQRDGYAIKAGILPEEVGKNSPYPILLYPTLPNSIPSHTGGGPPPPDGSFEDRMLAQWKCNKSVYPINRESGRQIIAASVARGAKPCDIEAAFWNESTCSGKKIWEVLDPLVPKSKGQETWLDRLNSIINDGGSNGTH